MQANASQWQPTAAIGTQCQQWRKRTGRWTERFSINTARWAHMKASFMSDSDDHQSFDSELWFWASGVRLNINLILPDRMSRMNHNLPNSTQRFDGCGRLLFGKVSRESFLVCSLSESLSGNCSTNSVCCDSLNESLGELITLTRTNGVHHGTLGAEGAH